MSKNWTKSEQNLSKTWGIRILGFFKKIQKKYVHIYPWKTPNFIFYALRKLTKCWEKRFSVLCIVSGAQIVNFPIWVWMATGKLQCRLAKSCLIIVTMWLGPLSWWSDKIVATMMIRPISAASNLGVNHALLEEDVEQNSLSHRTIEKILEFISWNSKFLQ